MEFPIYTVIMPTYNSELTLKRSIDSIIYQDFDLKKIELIIVDDCSTDDTWSKLNNYQSYNMLADHSLYQTKKNSGPGIARNIGINSAQGDFVVFLDSDDELKSKIIAEALKRTGSPKKEIVELNSISTLIRRMISSSKARNSNEYSYQSFGYIHQQFESKSGMMSISLSPYFYFSEDTKDLTKVENNGIIDISFKASGGSYADVTGGGDATQVIATVMEYAFAVFSVVESALKILFPDFYEWKKSEDQKVIKFSGVNNFGGINPNAKTAREGTNKRNRLYSLGWDRAMRKRATDLELYDGGYGTIYIKYKGSASSSPAKEQP
jgi:glycosyltransferase involved in cell wall biosynthesis